MADMRHTMDENVRVYSNFLRLCFIVGKFHWCHMEFVEEHQWRRQFYRVDYLLMNWFDLSCGLFKIMGERASIDALAFLL